MVHIVLSVRKDALRNRDTIITATRQLLAEHGPDVSMEMIAASAGLAVGTLYCHYRTKAELITAAIEDSLRQMAELAYMAVTAIGTGADPGDELRELLEGIANLGAENRAVRSAARSLGLPEHPGPDLEPPLPESPLRVLVSLIDRVLEAGRAAGVVRQDVTRVDLAVLLRGVLDIELDEAERTRYIEIILTGLRPPTDAR
jgi:AcrR family transcriptional regulator